MTLKHIGPGLGKLVLASLAAFAGTILGGVAAGVLGIPTPEIPPGTEPGALLLAALLTGFLLAALLAFISRRLSGGFLTRWLVLFLFTWVVYGLNNYLEASIFTAFAGASAYNAVTSLFSTLLVTLLLTWLFPPAERGRPFVERARAFFAARPAGQWSWRLLLALLSFPAAYLVFGSLVAPYVIEYYRQQVGGMALPGWDQILPVLAVRSLLFLLACLPALIAWQRSRLSLFLTLGTALFLLVGGLNLLGAYWLPVALRLPHGLEILADSFVHAAALVFLLVGSRPERLTPAAAGDPKTAQA